MKLKPLGDKVVLLPIEEESKTISGIVLQNIAKEVPTEAKVVAVGTGVIGDGKTVNMEVKVDDTVVFTKYSGSEVTLDNKDYIIIKQSDILAIVEEA